MNRQRRIAGLAIWFGGIIIFCLALTSPPAVYAHNSQQVQSSEMLEKEVYSATSERNDSIAHIRDFRGESQTDIRESLRSQTEVSTNSKLLRKNEYITSNRSIYYISKQEGGYSFNRIANSRKLAILSFNTAELPSRNSRGIRQTLTEQEVVNKTISNQEFNSFTRVHPAPIVVSKDKEHYLISSRVRLDAIILYYFPWLVCLIATSGLSAFGVGILISKFPLFHYLSD